MKFFRRTFVPLVILGAVMLPGNSASASTSYGFDESDMSAPIVLDDGAITITTNDFAEASGDINNGDPGGWSILAHSAPNVIKIWDNIDIALTSPSDGFEIYCTGGNTGPVTLTITTYLDGVIVDGPTTQDLGALNEWELVTGGSTNPIDQISIVGRETGNSSNTVAFGCDDLTLSMDSATTTTDAVTTTTEEATTTTEAATSTTADSSTSEVPTSADLQNELADSGIDGVNSVALFTAFLIFGAILMFISRYRTEQ